MASNLNKVFFFSAADGDSTALYCKNIRVGDDGVMTADVINGGWGLWFDGSTLKACAYKQVSPSGGFDWEYRTVMDAEHPVSVTEGVILQREVVVPPAFARLKDYNEVIAWARGLEGGAEDNFRAALRPKDVESWGESPVVAIGYNRTDSGHHMTPAMRVPVMFDEDEGLFLHSGQRRYGLEEYLSRLVDNQSRLCRVWLLTEDGGQHCCYWYEQGDLDYSMLTHFDTVARLANLGTSSPVPARSPAP